MSIDQEDTRIELIHAEDEAKYLLRDSREILAILKHIVTARALVSARLAPGRESYLSALIQADDGEDGVLLDASADPSRIERPPVQPAPDPVTGPVELPHWTEPPTGQVPKVVAGRQRRPRAERTHPACRRARLRDPARQGAHPVPAQGRATGG